MLTVIAVFSKYGLIVPLKSIAGVEVAEAFNTIFKERRTKKFCVDKGKKFYNKNAVGSRVVLHRK